MLLGRLDERLRLPLESFKPEIPKRLSVALGQDADLNVTRHSAILAEDASRRRKTTCVFSLAIRFLFAYHCLHGQEGVDDFRISIFEFRTQGVRTWL